jgi:uncharacterized membrane protein YfhO
MEVTEATNDAGAKVKKMVDTDRKQREMLRELLKENEKLKSEKYHKEIDESRDEEGDNFCGKESKANTQNQSKDKTSNRGNVMSRVPLSLENETFSRAEMSAYMDTSDQKHEVE